MNEERKVVLITGASSGIGEAAAVRLARDGHRVFLGARRTERLEALVARIADDGGEAAFRRLDVTDATDVEQFVRTARERWGRVDVIVNNAGVMPLSPLAERKVAEWDRMIDVNIRGVLHGISAVLPVMQDQGGGHIINVASVGAYEVVPTSAVYSATKFAVRAITEGLRQESPDGIRVTLISPGSPNPNWPNRYRTPRRARRCRPTARSRCLHRPSRAPSPSRWNSPQRST